MTEKQFTKLVIEIAHRFGWTVAHFPTSMREGRFMTATTKDGIGYPDLTLVRERIVFAELKLAYNKMTPAQSEWRTKIVAAGGTHYLWRPEDMKLIEETLRVRRPAAPADTVSP